MRSVMKSLLGLLGISCLHFCQEQPESIDRYTISNIKIDSVLIPKDTMQRHEIAEITTYSTYKNWCDQFYSFQYKYSSQSLERKVAIAIINDNEKTCGTTKSFPNSFTFKPVEIGTYTLKFWQGGDQWIEKNIVVQ